MKEETKILIQNDTSDLDEGLIKIFYRNKLHYYLSRLWRKRILFTETMEDYLKLPYSQRHYFGFIYKPFLPRIEEVHNLHELLEKDRKSERNIYLRENYPIQFFFRETLIRAIKRLIDIPKYKIIRWKEKLSDYFFPKQKWLYKKFPKQWTDKPEIIRISLFEIVVHFVEEEGELDHFNPDDVLDEHKDQWFKFCVELKECYEYIKNERPKLQKKIDDFYYKSGDCLMLPLEDNCDDNCEKDYAKQAELEDSLSEIDTKYLTWIAANRDFMWN